MSRGAKRRFGQHFLEPAWVTKVIRAIQPDPTETFLEIGPGRGALTAPLAAAAGSVLAFEIDRDLAAGLRRSAPLNLKVIDGDFLDVTADGLSRELAQIGSPHAVRVAGNLPYNVASPILFALGRLYAAGLPIVDATVMLQREVAARLLAPVGTKEYGVLSVLVRHWADVTKVLSLPPGAFRPSPKVHSTVVRLRFHAPDPAPASADVFAALVQAVFTRRRKTLANALLAYPPSATLSPARALEQAGIDGRRRPETLAVAELVGLADVFVPAVL